jgi:predicted ATPase/class 3 adenylate cyclase
MSAQPTGTVTLLFSDVEGSTRVLQRLGRERYAEALAVHRGLLREAFERHRGYEVDYEGDSFFVAFADAEAAVAAAAEAQEALARVEWPEGERFLVRMGVHTGEPAAEPPKYVGLDVHLAARIMAAGHGGQVLLSETTYGLAGRRAADLGEHRLKDFDEPVRLYQLGGRRFPPLLTVANTNLVRPSSSFVGRQIELAEIAELLRSETRLLTLTGAGGTGKTRLALEAAFESIESYPNGVWFVPLASVTDEAFLEPAIADTVGVRGKLHEGLHSKRLLLVLDNLEQLHGASPIIAGLLNACPDVRVLATSRERLDLTIEQEYPVSPLAPDAAAELFVQRARLRTPGFEPNESVLEIARRLDGLPLAVELAAARVKVLAPAQMLERLDRSLEVIGGGPGDLPERHRTLRGTIDWSYELLDDAEQTLFRRLGVFAGTFDLDAAEAVGAADLDTLASLVDKSLLRRFGDSRFTMLQVLREYARSRLDTPGETHDASLAHALHYRELAERVEPELKSSRRRELIDRLEADHANFVRAIEWALEADDPELACDLFGKLRYVWWDRSQREGWLLAQRVLAASPERTTSARGLALGVAAALAVAYDVDQAVSLAEQALEIFVELDETIRIANTSVFLGNVYQAIGRPGGRELLERGLGSLQAAGDNYGATIATTNLSDFALQEGDFALAARLAEEAEARAREHGFEDLEATATFNHAVALVHEADPRAAETARAALRLSARAKLQLFIGMSHFAVAAAVADTEPKQAALLLGAAETELQDAHLPPVETAVYTRATTTSRDALGAGAFEQLLEEGRLLTRDAAVELGLGVGDAPAAKRSGALGAPTRSP